MYEKYNAALRACSTSNHQTLGRLFNDLCKGNKYTTTLHLISSAILRLSKLLPAVTVYRGVRGGELPSELWDPNVLNMRGGFEIGFMSTTLDKAAAFLVAEKEAEGESGDELSKSCVFEVQLGLMDQGAELSWLSQYPHEEEVCMGALTGLEIMKTRVHASTLVMEARPNRNLTAVSIEQVMST